MAPPAEHPKDIKVEIYKALHELKMVSPGHFTAAMRQLGNLESKEILGVVSAPADRVFVQQGRAQMIHEIIAMLVECSDKTRSYQEKLANGSSSPVSTG